MSVSSGQKGFLEPRLRESRAPRAEAPSLEFLSAGGEMGALVRAYDWSKTALGAPHQWPQSLKTAVSICLGSRHPIVVWWGRSDYTQFYNDAYISFLGASKHPASLGRSGRACWSEIWPVIGPMLEGVYASGEATWSEDLLLVLDRNLPREEGYFTFSYSPIRDENGLIGGIFCACNETTGRVLGERRLKSLRDLSRMAVEARAEGACALAARTLDENPADMPFSLIYLLDRDGRQARLVAATGLQAGGAASPHSIDLEDGPGSAPPWPLRQVADTGAARLVSDLAETFGPLPGGPWPESAEAALVVPIAAPGQSRPTGFLVSGLSPRRVFDADYRSFLDLVARQIGTSIANARAYEDERRRAEALAEIDRAKTRFFSNVSHEFRTPLTLMLGPLEDALASTGLPAAERAQLEVAQRNALRLLKLVNALLDFSRFEAGRAQATYEPVDLAALTADLASNFRSACERAGLSLVVDCPALPEPVHVDRDMWEKIVLNLLSNAFKFTFEGEIAVRLRAAEGHAELSVRDTGVGIPEPELPRLFERFHRIEGQRSRTLDGSGIGLALVQELVKLHGGAIRAESAVGRGTRFTVSIPLGTAHLPQDPVGAERRRVSTSVRADAYVQEALRWLSDVAAPSAEGAEQRHESRDLSRLRAGARILLADDNADMRAYLRRLLESQCEVQAAADGNAALEAIRERRPDLVIADVMMPGLDGFGLLRAIRGDPALQDIPVIMLSARAGEESRVEGLSAGADDYLVKPFSARELTARVGAILMLASAREQDRAKLRGRRRILEMVATGVPLAETLDALMLFLEAQEPGMRCAILPVADDGAHFRRGSGPRLPEAYHAALDGVPIAPPYLGPCCEAAHQGCAVVVRDIASETRYAEDRRALLLSCGIRAARSTPVLGADRRVLASIAMYFDEPRDPTPAEPELAEKATHLAAIALERARAEGGLRKSHADLRVQNVELSRTRDRLRLLVEELNHRVKNTLATVQSIATQTLRTAPTTADGREALEARLVALSKAHDVLTREHWEGADLHELVTRAMSAYASDRLAARLELGGAQVRLRPRAVLAISMALHELATNAVKYGALSNETGRVRIAWAVQGEPRRFRLDWAETDGPPVGEPDRRGFGSRLIEQGLAHDLGGDARLSFAREGLMCRIEAPADEICAEGAGSGQRAPGGRDGHPEE